MRSGEATEPSARRRGVRWWEAMRAKVAVGMTPGGKCFLLDGNQRVAEELSA